MCRKVLCDRLYFTRVQKSGRDPRSFFSVKVSSSANASYALEWVWQTIIAQQRVVKLIFSTSFFSRGKISLSLLQCEYSPASSVGISTPYAKCILFCFFYKFIFQFMEFYIELVRIQMYCRSSGTIVFFRSILWVFTIGIFNVWKWGRFDFIQSFPRFFFNSQRS